MKRALICGVGGQDGSYLAKLLLSKGYEVFGTSRDAQIASFSNLCKLGIREEVQTLSMALNDFRSVLHVLNRIKPDEVYNLSGQSSVGLSFEQPAETMESISYATLNLLEVIRFLNLPIKLYNAGSSECFGNVIGQMATEQTAFNPRSPYAVAKAAAHWQVSNYREAYNLFTCTGVLFNHESCLRPSRFVTQKIVASAKRIAAGSTEKLTLGNIKIIRDWGWAPDYVEAMWLMLQQQQPDDFIISSGRSISLEDFVEMVFTYLGLDWKQHVLISEEFFRPTDIMESYGNPAKARDILGWTASTKIEDVALYLVEGRY